MIYLQALTTVLQPSVLLYLGIGVVVGGIIGSLPGLSVVMGIAILTPVTFALDSTQGLAMLLGVYNSGVWAGGISAILVNTPGTPASIMSTMDGYAMTKRGEAGMALGINTIYSVVGGLFSTIVLMVAAFPIAEFALNFGPAEYFSLALFGLSMIIGVSGKSVTKGLLVGFLGFLISTIGLDSMFAFPRFTFGNTDLLQGISYVPVMIGLFGVGEVLIQVFDREEAAKKEIHAAIGKILPSGKQFRSFAPMTALSAVVGTIVGAIPGAGGDIASIICWDQCKKLSKDKKNYGNGSPEGLAVTCTANNAVIGGAMTTMLALGIPGDAVTAVLIGSLMMYGMQPGPMLFVQNQSFVVQMMAMMVVANLLIIVMGLITARASVNFIKLKKEVIWIAVLLLCVVGSYSINNSLTDVYIMLIFGVVGFFLRRFDFPVAPMILALILGPMAESNLRRALSMSAGSYIVFVSSPISGILLVMTACALAGPQVISKIRSKKNKQAAAKQS